MFRPHPVKRATLYIVLIFFIGIALYGYFGVNKVNEKVSQDLLAEQSQPDTRENLSYKEETNNDETENYVLDIKYPALDGGTNINALNKINSNIFSLVEKTKSDFVVSLEGSPLFSENKSTLNIFTKDVSATDSFINVSLAVSMFQSGAAHPYSYTQVLSFKKDTGEKIVLADLFKEGSLYLLDVSNAVMQKLDSYLSGQGLTDWFKEGADPLIENYDNFLIDEDGIHFIFASSQVAPYVFGEVDIFVPFVELPNILISG